MKNIYRIYYGLLLCLLLPAAAFAQDITGLVQDPAGRPIAGVGVSAGVGVPAVLTNTRGRFALTGTPKDTLIFSKTGYLTKTIVVHGERDIRITLRLALQEMEEVKIVSN